jgi:hypothetical protein
LAFVRKTLIFFAENWQKSHDIVIIPSTPAVKVMVTIIGNFMTNIFGEFRQQLALFLKKNKVMIITYFAQFATIFDQTASFLSKTNVMVIFSALLDVVFVKMGIFFSNVFG